MTETKIVPAKHVEVKRLEEYEAVYTNAAQVSFSPFDLRIDFGDSVVEGDIVKVHQKVQVVMSPQHAVALSKALAEAVAKYGIASTDRGKQK